jgi:hypothetical protein
VHQGPSHKSGTDFTAHPRRCQASFVNIWTCPAGGAAIASLPSRRALSVIIHHRAFAIIIIAVNNMASPSYS